ncbi:MAG: hypothetical protein AUJ72_05170 [Candidatus Omnitrophica bacterium CG1_02_46_14]|nr:MAG: hypothetical protein AUJ72_05170 [Candidatus Omnitrophica bacterium CG1_02_46_14]
MFFLFLSWPLFADTIHLKNGSKVEGIIEHEYKEGVELNLGYGTTTFNRSEIDHIEKSDTAQKEALWQSWSAEEKEIERRKPEEEKKWHERQKELERMRLEEENLRKSRGTLAPKDISVFIKNQTMLTNVLLNGSVRVNLILDSGAANVLLTRSTAEKLGLEIDKLKIINTQVADGRRVQAAMTTLDSVLVQNAGVQDNDTEKNPGIEARRVDACVILDEIESGKVENGLLGVSFLKNFKFQADFTNRKVIFERLKESDVKPS